MGIVKTNPMKLQGPWNEGYVLDYHTISSVWTGDPYRYDTKRTELGERVYGLKYGGANILITDVVDTVEAFIGTWKPAIDSLVPAPPSKSRAFQPVVEIVREIAARLGLPPCEDAVVKVNETPQMKNIGQWSEREKLLQVAIQEGPETLRVSLFC